MSGKPPKFEISPLSCEFTDQDLTVDVQIFKIGDNDGWTLEVIVDEATAVVWTELFPTDRQAWDDFAKAAADVGLRRLLDADSAEATTIH